MAGFGADKFGIDPFGSVGVSGEIQIIDFSVTGSVGVSVVQIVDFNVSGQSGLPRVGMYVWTGATFAPVDLYYWDGTKAVPQGILYYAPINQ